MDYNQLLESCKDAIAYLREHGDPHCTIVITQNSVRLMRDEIGIPVTE